MTSLLEIPKYKTRHDYGVHFPAECGFVLFEFLSPHEMMQICYLFPEWKEIYDKYHLREKNEATCYYTKLNYKEAALGFGNNTFVFLFLLLLSFSHLPVKHFHIQTGFHIVCVCFFFGRLTTTFMYFWPAAGGTFFGI